MRKLLMLCCSMIAMCVAAHEADTTTVVSASTKSIIVANDSDTIVVSRDFHAMVDFSLPFTRSSRDSDECYSLNISGVSLGCVSALNTSPSFSSNFGQSIEVTWHMLNFNFTPHLKWVAASTGLWLNWKNYRTTGRTRFLKQDADIVIAPYPDGADIKFSRLHFFSLELPLLVHFRTKAQVRFVAGAIVNYTPHGSLKTRYKLDGHNYKDTSNDISHVSLSADLFANVSYKGYGLYFKYSPCNVLQTEYGPRLNGLSAGVSLLY